MEKYLWLNAKLCKNNEYTPKQIVLEIVVPTNPHPHIFIAKNEAWPFPLHFSFHASTYASKKITMAKSNTFQKYSQCTVKMFISAIVECSFHPKI